MNLEPTSDTWPSNKTEVEKLAACRDIHLKIHSRFKKGGGARNRLVRQEESNGTSQMISCVASH
jgi:hypothetical protein